MIDEFAKDSLHGRLRRDREALLWKLDGLSEYDARRPLTATGTNLLGLVKHVATVEARYFGEVFDRPSPEPLPRWQDSDGSDHWAAEHETRDRIRHPARGHRRPNRNAARTRDADRPGSPRRVPREDRAGREIGRIARGVEGHAVRNPARSQVRPVPA